MYGNRAGNKSFRMLLLLSVCLLLPGVAGRAYAQGGRFTPAQEAWLRTALLNRTGSYEAAAINAAHWTNWWAQNQAEWYYLLDRTDNWDQAVSDVAKWNTWSSLNTNKISGMYSRTSAWDQATIDGSSWSSWITNNYSHWAYMLSRTSAWDQAVTDSANRKETGIWGLDVSGPALTPYSILLCTNAGVWFYAGGAVRPMTELTYLARDPYWITNSAGSLIPKDIL